LQLKTFQKTIREFVAEIKKILLIGNPNSGKSTLFNQLTGIFQKIANYPGVTTEKKSGILKTSQHEFEIIDLPGCYSLYPNSIDEKVVIDELINHHSELIIFVADASNLQRSLLLYTQVADCHIPNIVVINMADELSRKGEEIDIDFLSKELGVPVFQANSKKGEGINSIIQFIENGDFKANEDFFGNSDLFENKMNNHALNYREWQQYVYETTNNAIIENTKRKEIIFRYNKIEKILQLTTRKTAKAFKRLRWTDRLDQWALHPIIGYLLLFLILFAVFQTLFTLASYPMEWLDSLFGAIASYLQTFENPKWFIEFLAEAVIPGIGGVLIFIPQIALLFLLNTFLEESGYMARIVFLLDRFMRRFGLSGKSILPLLSGNACAIPAMASTKAIPTHKERLITILTIPFMTCSARLPVYALLISITIPLKFQGATLLGLYLLGVIFALLFAWILDKNIQTKEKSFLIMELPPYRLPSFRNVVTNIKNAVIPFVMTAGKFIISISIILWLLGSFHFENRQLERTHIENSFLSQIGKSIEPAIKPLGYDWKIGIALLSSFAAREVFVSTLATLYQIDSEDEGTIFEKIKNQKNATTLEPIYTTAVGISLLLFYAFALQCMSTLAAMKKETGSWKYPLFSFTVMLGLAYISAFLAFRVFK
jgi:ferrous iron transport protein B